MTDSRAAGSVNKVLQFQEKPDVAKATSFLQAGNFYWNAGIFVWKASTIIEAFHVFQSELHQIFCADITKYGTESEVSFVEDAFNKCEDISIDFAIMEHAKNVSVVLTDFDWSDLGTWGSLSDHLSKDQNNNAIVGENVFLFNSNNCLIHVPTDKLVVLDGLENTIVVESNNMLLVLHKDNEQELKKYLKNIESSLPHLFA